MSNQAEHIAENSSFFIYIFSDPRFWVGLAFIVVILLLGKKIYFFIDSKIVNYQKKIISELDEAKHIKNKAITLRDQRSKEKNLAEEEIQQNIKNIEKYILQLESDAKEEIDNNFDNQILAKQNELKYKLKYEKITLLQEAVDTAFKDLILNLESEVNIDKTKLYNQKTLQDLN